MIERYYRESALVEAVVWTGLNLQEVIDFTGIHPSAASMPWNDFSDLVAREGLKLFTKDDNELVPVGSWIVKDFHGNLYFMPSSAFQACHVQKISDEARLESREVAFIKRMRRDYFDHLMHSTTCECALCDLSRVVKGLQS